MHIPNVLLVYMHYIATDFMDEPVTSLPSWPHENVKCIRILKITACLLKFRWHWAVFMETRLLKIQIEMHCCELKHVNNLFITNVVHCKRALPNSLIHLGSPVLPVIE